MVRFISCGDVDGVDKREVGGGARWQHEGDGREGGWARLGCVPVPSYNSTTVDWFER